MMTPGTHDSARGPVLGLLMLQTRFPRYPGDIGNPSTWPFEVVPKVVAAASADRVIRRKGADLLPDFVAAAHELTAAGCDGIATSCGFLALFQAPLRAACSVPVATSSLLQIASLRLLLPPAQRVGVVTFSADDLTPDHLAAAGAPVDTPVEGLDPASDIYRAIIEDRPDFDQDRAEAETVAACCRLVQRHPEVGAIVFECTNLPPYSAAASAAVGRPVFDVVSFLTWFAAGLRPRRFPRGDS